MPDETDTNSQSDDDSGQPVDVAPVSDGGGGQSSGTDQDSGTVSPPATDAPISAPPVDLGSGSDDSSGNSSSILVSDAPVAAPPPDAAPINSPAPVDSMPMPAAPPENSSLSQKFLDHIKNWRQQLQKAAADRELKKQQQISRVYLLAQQKKYITREDVRNLLHCGHTAAAQYLAALEKQGKLRTVGAPHTPNQKYQVIN